MSNASIRWVWALAFSAVLALAAGCASETGKPAPPPAAQQPSAPPSNAASEDLAVKLPPGAARPPAPFPGQGW